MQEVDWEAFRRPDQSLDLVELFKVSYPYKMLTGVRYDFLMQVQSIRPVTSRQVAAIAIAMAGAL